MMDLREQIARAIHGNCDRELDASWGDWLPEADAVIEVLAQQEPVAWMCSSEALLRIGYQKFSTTCSGDWNIPVYAVHQGAQADVPDGWQLVPIDPTPPMLDAAENLDWSNEDVRGNCCNQWHAMLAASPNPEAK